MAHLINEGYPGGEALDAAAAKHAHYWDMEDKVVAADTSGTLASIQDAEAAGSYSQPPRGQKRPAEGKGAGGKNPKGKGKGKQASRDQQGRLTEEEAPASPVPSFSVGPRLGQLWRGWGR